ncbi:MAG: sulfurtransferase TusA family protein [Peptococcaceae bacterium]|nr:sulfurtransferase TusA family protein [Peptococcaceae bacterium]MDH7524907.1 sulfurtransferase TusA family protein [Peptococcaceae bacterium]
MQVDARGMSCPEPLLMTKKAMGESPAGFQVIVDNNTARENVSRFARGNGYRVKVEQDGNDYVLTITRE